jgi:extracellular solute-binding protein (family 5)
LLRRLAATSLAIVLLLAVLPARSARRPRYGGTLRVEIGTAVPSFDPSAPTIGPAQTSAKNQIDSLIYESRDPDGSFNGDSGSGPFKISAWQPGKQLTLLANEKFREGRPFVDSLEITMGRPFGDRLLDLELNKTDFTDIPPQEARHAAERGIRISQSQPEELLAIVFLDARTSATNARARDAIGQALSLSIDRSAIVTFLLQKVGEPSRALLPQWSSGTSFLFSTAADVPRAKELLSQITASPKFVLGYDSADPLEQSVAERIVVNAKEAGISLTAVGVPATGSAPDAASSSQKTGAGAKAAHAALPVVDARLVRVAISSSKTAAALNELLRAFNSIAGGGISTTPLRDSSSASDIYQREREILDKNRIIPLVWLPQVYGLNARVRNWIPPLPGQSWPLADVWLDADDKGADIKDRS